MRARDAVRGAVLCASAGDCGVCAQAVGHVNELHLLLKLLQQHHKTEGRKRGGRTGGVRCEFQKRGIE